MADRIVSSAHPVFLRTLDDENVSLPDLLANSFDLTTNLFKVESSTSGSNIEETLLDAVVVSGVSTEVDVSSVSIITIQIIASSVTDGGSLIIQTSLDNTNWATVGDAISIDGNGVTDVSLSGVKYKYIRVNLTRTDGTYTVLLMAGN